jgi:hypothetical protein
MTKPTAEIKPFFFKNLNDQEVIDLLNEEYPIKLIHNQDLINRIHARYPVIPKHEVSLIVLEIFKGIRELLIKGKRLSFNKIFFDMRFSFFTHTYLGRILPALKTKISMPLELRD